MYRQGIFLLALTCVLAHISVVQAICCRTSSTLNYKIHNGDCGFAGGVEHYNGCTITICANGNRLEGTFCGRGSCNIFGCDCDGGCISGDWRESFLDNNQHLDIEVTSQKWN